MVEIILSNLRLWEVEENSKRPEPTQKYIKGDSCI
jgi:hypothetical protein